jgi:hypothetical protein
VPVNSDVRSQELPCASNFCWADLDDGRIVVINSSTDGHRPGPEHSARVLSGAFNVPLGTEFTKLVSRSSIDDNAPFQGETDSVSLTLSEIEFFRTIMDTVPAGHNAAIRLEGEGMDLVHQRLASKSTGIDLYLVADDAET